MAMLYTKNDVKILMVNSKILILCCMNQTFMTTTASRVRHLQELLLCIHVIATAASDPLHEWYLKHKSHRSFPTERKDPTPISAGCTNQTHSSRQQVAGTAKGTTWIAESDQGCQIVVANIFWCHKQSKQLTTEPLSPERRSRKISS